MNKEDILCIRGGRPLQGRIQISGAKNSAVALIPAAILASTKITIDNLPSIGDVLIYKEILESLACEVHLEGDQITIDPSRIKIKEMANGPIKKLRASYYLMGALLGRFGEAVVGLPGGCDIGPRPIDQHIKGFEALGARVEWENGAIHLKAERLVGARIYLDVVSVGATINIMLAAAMAEGQTIIENVAKEPEIIDVATLLSSMGAQIKGVGTDMIKIIGVPELRGCRHSIIPDRIEAGTYMIAAAASGGDVILDNVIPKHLDPITAKLREIGIEIEEGDDTIRVTAQKNYRAIDLKTLPYPGFPTDLQQPITTLLTLAEGTSIVTDNIYSSRFKHVEELRKLGANIYVEGRSAVIHGGTALIGTKVIASDLRAGASLVVAGLMAEGVTEIANVEYIDRGYEKLEEKITALGGEIWREKR